MILQAFTERVRFARALRHPAYAWWWIGRTISFLGDSAFRTALAWQVLLITGSGQAMGNVLIASSLPMVAFLLLGGVVADRFPRLRVLLWSDSVQAVAILLIAVLGLLHMLELWHLVVLSLVFGTASGFFIPANQAIAPQLVPEEDLTSANALRSTSEQLSRLIGPMIGAALIALMGPTLAFAFDGFSFVISIICILCIRGATKLNLDVAKEDREIKTIRQQFTSVIADIREGLSYIISYSWLWVSILLVILTNIFLTGSGGIALPKLIEGIYHADAWVLGIGSAMGAIGAMIAGITVAQRAKIKHRGIWAYVGILITGFGMLAYSIPVSLFWLPFLIGTAAFFYGAGLEIYGIIWTTAFQELVPQEKQGRVFSVVALGSFALIPIGYTFSGPMVDAWGPWSVFLLGGVLIVCAAIVAFLTPSLRKL